MRKTGSQEVRDFIAIKGRFSLHITPQTPRGWRLLGIWTGVLMLPTVPLIVLAIMLDDTPQEYLVLWALVATIIATGVVTIVMIRWMLARADVVSPEELRALTRNRTSGSSRRRD